MCDDILQRSLDHQMFERQLVEDAALARRITLKDNGGFSPTLLKKESLLLLLTIVSRRMDI